MCLQVLADQDREKRPKSCTGTKSDTVTSCSRFSFLANRSNFSEVKEQRRFIGLCKSFSTGAYSVDKMLHAGSFSNHGYSWPPHSVHYTWNSHSHRRC